MQLPVSHIPEALQGEFDAQWSRILHALCEQERIWLEKALCDYPALGKEMATAVTGSRYFADQLQRNFVLFQQLFEGESLWNAYPENYYENLIAVRLEAIDAEPQLDTCLRRLRQQEMLRLIYRDFNRLADMEQTTREISWLADACVDAALKWHYQRLCLELGTPMSRHTNKAQQMVVLGMGKLGAYELNLSSDIDLIFTYPEGGETRGGARSVDNQQFFLKLGQRLIKSIDTVTVDGFVFRVDMRLRPYGQSGVLALSFDAMEEYYQDQGRDWERYAMIKARVIAGDKKAGEELMGMLRPFVYRRYIDFSAIESLRDMKAMINREVKRRGKANDVKLGAGGIREIEFIVQSFQLIRGGRQPELQQRELQLVLDELEKSDCLPADVVQELRAAYIFLRNTEHAIQGYMDKQTQALPADDIDCQRLAFVMGYPDWQSFSQVLQAHRDVSHSHFLGVVSSPEEQHPEAIAAHNEWVDLWSQELEEKTALQLLQQTGYENAEDSLRLLMHLHNSRQIVSMQTVGRQRLNEFMPLLLQSLAQSSQPSLTFSRILPLVEAVVRRTAYLVLLVENPQALQQLIVLCGASPWIAQQLAYHPVLLDELLNTGTLYAPPELSMLRQDLSQQMLRIPWDDLEAQMEGLRYFKLAHVLRIAASEVSGRLPLMKVSDYLTWIAEVLLDHVLSLVWQQLTARHGFPLREDGEPCDGDFIIVAYGKMGGIELGHGSDLDLVFIHNGDSSRDTDGDKAIETGVFFTRLGQRIIHVLSTQTHLGQLYEIDMRLRPSGEKGLLVSSLKAFADYQHKHAWTWEHQALVRARVVAGCPQLQKKFESLRSEILCRARDLQDLQTEVVQMRQKMADHLIPAQARDEKNGLFDLKHSRGGIVDIEFMVQYAVLAWAHQYPALVRWTDNIRILESLQKEGLFKVEEVQALTDAYKGYRMAAHRLALQKQAGVLPVEQFAEHRQAVLAKWRDLFASACGGIEAPPGSFKIVPNGLELDIDSH